VDWRNLGPQRARLPENSASLTNRKTVRSPLLAAWGAKMKRAYRDAIILACMGVVLGIEALTVGPHGTGWGRAGVLAGIVVCVAIILTSGYFFLCAGRSSD
jgi:hypothetical protein